MASNSILAYAMEQGDKMALTGMRNPVVGRLVCLQLRAQPREGAGQCPWSGKGMWEGAGPQAVLGLVAHSSNLISGSGACLRAGTVEKLLHTLLQLEKYSITTLIAMITRKTLHSPTY